MLDIERTAGTDGRAFRLVGALEGALERAADLLTTELVAVIFRQFDGLGLGIEDHDAMRPAGFA